MAWEETRPGQWQRPIGENEALIKCIGDAGKILGKDVWSISATATFVAQVEPKSLSRALRDGWKLLRFRHPSIATVADDGVLEYRVPSLVGLEQWADEIFVYVETGINLDDVIANLKPTRFATLYYLQESSSLVLYLSHWRTDGVGAFHLLNAFFNAVIESLKEETPWSTVG
ncbi:hypothetical protein GGS23DRAFT_617507 [Durotheca rogersii]|uniref:uncharacterized protein n=1 Tax=Durotheca rogersii TaxID=419775 RepID=UPI00221EFFE6|nr:uncharacterized protein GGS23DRAFT_617507 [Durotheca rogersii]KAI5866392.1 hypothetical protein GGS23DRAFT_617507 [Durotheca rogersii]